MDLTAVLGLLQRRWRIIAASLVLALAAGGFATSRAIPIYESSGRVFVNIPHTGTPGELLQGVQASSQLLQSYAEVATSRLALQRAASTLGGEFTAGRLRGSVTAAPEPRTLFIRVSARDSDPVRARSVAQTVTAVLIETVDRLESGRVEGSKIEAELVDPPVTPGAPVLPRRERDLAVAGLLGLLVGLGGALARDALDRSVNTVQQAESLVGAPVLGAIPRSAQPALAGHADAPGDLASEAYRALRTGVRFLDPDHPLQTIAVTSASASEGKTTTAVNLAISLSQAGERVCLVDADLRRANVAATLGLEGAVGLTSVVTRQVALEESLQYWGDSGLAVLASGPLPPNPSELVGSQSMRIVLERLRAQFDIVILDAPPVLPVTDAVVLSTQVDGTLVVVRAGQTQRAAVAEARRRIEAVSGPIVGTVLNAVSTSGENEYYSEYRPRRT